MRISEKAKKTVSRKTFMAVVVSMMVCLLFVTPVFAASRGEKRACKTGHTAGYADAAAQRLACQRTGW